MASQGNLSYSMELRDIIKRMVADEIETRRPRYRYATVKAIDRTNRKCDVIYTGETEPVRVNMGSIQPHAVDQVVRIEGIGTDKFISDVIGRTYTPSLSATGSLEVPEGIYAPSVGTIDSAVPNIGWLKDRKLTSPRIAVPLYTNQFTNFDSSYARLQVTRIGDVVVLTGAIRNTNAYNTPILVGQIPNVPGLRPTSTNVMGIGFSTNILLRYDIVPGGDISVYPMFGTVAAGQYNWVQAVYNFNTGSI